MTTFKEYLQQRKNETAGDKKLLSPPSQVEQKALSALEKKEEVSASLRLEMSTFDKKRQKFGKLARGVVKDERFINRLSDEIGEPKLDETEDEFVARAEAIMTNILKKKLKVKGKK